MDSDYMRRRNLLQTGFTSEADEPAKMAATLTKSSLEIYDIPINDHERT